MIEYIKSLIMGIIAGVTAPLPVSSSGHFSIGSKLLGFTEDGNVSAFYYSVFMVVFSVVIMINLRQLYSKLFKGFSENRKNYKLRFSNLIVSVVAAVVLFIPIPVLGRSLTDYFNMFFDSGNMLNDLLIGAASVFTGLILAVSVWYIRNGKGGRKKTVSVKSALRMCLYTIPAHIIPGASKVALSSVNLALSDINSGVLFREVYFYLAPQIFVVNLIRAILLLANGVQPEITSLILGVVAVALASLPAISVIRKTDSGKILLVFSVYSLIFGIGAIAYTLTPIFAGV